MTILLLWLERKAKMLHVVSFFSPALLIPPQKSLANHPIARLFVKCKSALLGINLLLRLCLLSPRS